MGERGAPEPLIFGAFLFRKNRSMDEASVWSERRAKGQRGLSVCFGWLAFVVLLVFGCSGLFFLNGDVRSGVVCAVVGCAVVGCVLCFMNGCAKSPI